MDGEFYNNKKKEREMRLLNGEKRNEKRRWVQK